MSDLLHLLSNGAFEKSRDKSEGHSRGKGGTRQERKDIVCSVFPPREKAQFLIPERDIGIMTPLFLSSLPLHITFTHLFIKLFRVCVCVCVCVCFLSPLKEWLLLWMADVNRNPMLHLIFTHLIYFIYVCVCMCVHVCVCVCAHACVYIYFSAVKRLIASKIRFCLHNTCVCCVYLCMYKYTHIQ